jgi:hypothetical protein
MKRNILLISRINIIILTESIKIKAKCEFKIVFKKRSKGKLERRTGESIIFLNFTIISFDKITGKIKMKTIPEEKILSFAYEKAKA